MHSVIIAYILLLFTVVALFIALWGLDKLRGNYLDEVATYNALKDCYDSLKRQVAALQLDEKSAIENFNALRKQHQAARAAEDSVMTTIKSLIKLLDKYGIGSATQSIWYRVDEACQAVKCWRENEADLIDVLTRCGIGKAGMNVRERLRMAINGCVAFNEMSCVKLGPGEMNLCVNVPDTLPKEELNLLMRFVGRMASKLQVFREKHGEREAALWRVESPGWNEFWRQQALLEHVAKGDPVDVANFCAFLDHFGNETSLMGYMQMTPGLEAAMRDTISKKGDIDRINSLEPSTLAPSFTFDSKAYAGESIGIPTVNGDLLQPELFHGNDQSA